MGCVQPAATSWAQGSQGALPTHQLEQLFPDESELGHEAAHQPQHLPGPGVLSLLIPFICLALGLCQGLPSEALSSPSFAGSPAVLLSSMESTQAVRTSRRPVVQYFIQEEIYTHLSLAGEQPAQGMFVQRKEPGV